MKTKTFLLLFALLLLGARPHALQPNILSVRLKDGVERWRRVKAFGEKPWFFQQVENLFNVVLPPKDQLPFGVSVALLVGVSEYAHLSPQLPFVKNDLRDMREFLLNDGGFDTVYVASEKIVNRDLVDGYVRNKIGRSLKPRDRFLFYYSGHGADTGGRTGYMQFAQALPNDFSNAQVMSIRTAVDWSSDIKNIGHMLFVFDCCASGLAFTSKGGPGDLLAALSGNGCRMIMTAGTAEEKTYEVEGRDGKGNGVFTRAFLNAAKSGSADQGTARDGFITIEEVLAQAKTEVARFAAIHKKSVTPRLWPLEETDYRGTFVFVNSQAQNEALALKKSHSQKLNARSQLALSVNLGVVRVIAHLSGEVCIGDSVVGSVDVGDTTDFDLVEGTHRIALRNLSETIERTVTISRNQIMTVVFFSKVVTRPEIKVAERAEQSLTPKAPIGMVYIPSGSFMMGSENGNTNEKSIHRVALDAFFMDKHEVTVEEYQRFLVATNRESPPEWSKRLRQPSYPVIRVKWDDADAYAKWLGKRLPTEAEWEYAARGGYTGIGGRPKHEYPWGQEMSYRQAQWAEYRFINGPTSVENYTPNGYGLFDMAGNVWEWCADWYDENYYQISPTNNPKGPSIGVYRVARGGSWNDSAEFLRCAYRFKLNPVDNFANVGFRCVQEVR